MARSELSPVQLDIFKDRYALPGEEHPEQMWDRVARAVAEAELEQDRPQIRDAFRNLLSDFKFVPGGRILLAMGNPAPSVTAMNCYVLPSPEDSRQGIISESLQQWVDIQATGGGVGINLSSLRPNGAPVHSVGGTSSGPVTWAKLFAFTSHDVIIQGGSRRGAAMLMLDDDHPDIFEFIHAKETPGTLEGANLSVCISDAFMDAVRNDNDWDLRWGGQVYRTVRASQLWHEICECAHNSGEPGIYFLERANQQANSGYFEKLVATNPCVTGDTLIMTLDGPRTFRELAEAGQDVKVYAWHPETNDMVIRWMRRPHKTGIQQPILNITLDTGTVVRCTPNHSFWRFRGQRGMEKTQASDLVVGQSIKAWSMSRHRDGHLRVHHWKDGKTAHQYVHRMVYEFEHGVKLSSSDIIHHVDHDDLNNVEHNLLRIDPITHNREHYPSRHANGFRGHEAGSAGLAAMRAGRERQLAETRNHKIIKIEDGGLADVYNGMVEDAHTYVIIDDEPCQGVESGIISANCGEQALGPYGACLLGAFNLAAYVRAPRNEAAYFDYDAFGMDISVAVRFNDNIIDLSSYPIEEAREAQLRIRRMGIGVMGLADALIKLGIIYGEPDSVRFTREIFATIAQRAYLSSSRLGVERGAFPAYDRREFEQRPFVQRVLNSIPGLAIPKMRNCYLISQAPTGTISLMAGVNSGIEPYFSFDYSRSDRIGDYDVTQAEWAETYATRRKGNASMAPWLVTAQDVKPKAHIAIQAACQEWNDSSVSKTINAPNSATVEDVKRAYMLAWESGLKSIAYYRDGSRDKQVLNHKNVADTSSHIVSVKLDSIESAHVHHRKRLPTTRRGVTHKFAVDGIEGYIHTGEYENGAPGEMFVDIAKVGSTIAGLVDWGATMTSLALQYGAPLEELTDKMIGTRFEPAGRTNDKEIPHATSVVDYIGAWMNAAYASRPAEIAAVGVPAETITVNDAAYVQVARANGNLCPTCSTPVVYLDGCESCRSCSWSRCG